MFYPVNGDGQLCGVDELAEFPKLYYIVKHDEKIPRAVCVDACPKEIDSQFRCHGTKAIDPSVCENEY